MLDLNIVKKYATSNVFFHIDKGNSKIVHIKDGQVIYTIGSTNNVQYQLLEALLEYIVKRFNEMFDLDVILTYENVNSNMFKNFKNEVEHVIENFNDLELIETIKAQCRVCDKVLPIHVKKSFIENSEDFPVPLVYEHAGHAILIFIDRNFDVRGVELVNTTG